MPTDDDTAMALAKTMDNTVLASDCGTSSQGATNGINIEALVDSRVQQKLPGMLGPLLAQLLKEAINSLQDNGCKKPLEPPNVVQKPEEAESAPNSQEKSDGVSFLQRNVPKGDKLSAWHDPREPQMPEKAATTPHWLKLIRVLGGDSDGYEIVILDKALRDRIRECLSSFITHTGENIWQEAEVVLVSEIKTLMFNYDILNDEASRQPADETREHLRELLELLRVIHSPSVFMCIKPDTHKDFRIEMEFIWSFFCPGKLIVANMRGFDSPQLLKIDNCDLKTKDQQTSITVFAWMWDWDGQNLVRSTYEFEKESPKKERVNPKEWDFYPIELYEASDGSKGLNALRQDRVLRDRRRLFIEYTGAHATNNHDANVLRYSGDAFGDAAAFSPSLNSRSKETLLSELFARLHRTRPEKKLIKLDEDIVLDTENYCRRVGEGRKFANQELAGSKFCKCSMCMDQNTKTWYQKMDAISKEKGAKLEFAINQAIEMGFNDNDLLLPPRVFGFALNKKEWCQFSLDKIQRSQALKFKDDGAEVQGLIFPTKVTEEERRDIFKLIRDHKRVMSNRRRLRDTIDGKGESLILLFHGHSGTGKTLYAESLAKACHLQLFKVGTSDIGLEVAHAERRLKEIFELAEFWNTVLLIDEADVLLDTRGKENESLVSKNALVSVLLREVEYFKGILIMTTNRVRAFDPAIMSRIHHAVDFEGSSQKQEMNLWNLWYEIVECEGASVEAEKIKKWMKDTNRKKRRNYLSGREIRNVFLVAQILAEKDGKGIKIGLDELERAYHYKDNFLAETEGKINEAKAMVMSGMKQ